MIILKEIEKATKEGRISSGKMRKSLNGKGMWNGKNSSCDKLRRFGHEYIAYIRMGNTRGRERRSDLVQCWDGY